MTPKVIGVGLNKTATKSLRQCLQALGYDNQTYSLEAFHLYQQRNWQALFDIMDQHSSFEDWPWPLMYREIEQRYPDAKFILTTRASADVWYRSLCKMAVRMGPLRQFEQHIYGYAMPQGRRAEHLSYYEKHNSEVRAYFSDKPDKLLEVCFDHGVSMNTFSEFLDAPHSDLKPPHVNKSASVYSGDSLYRAQVARVIFQTHWYTIVFVKKVVRKLLSVVRKS